MKNERQADGKKGRKEGWKAVRQAGRSGDD